MTVPTYIDGAALPDIILDWEDTTGDLIDFTNYTIELDVIANGTVLLNKTTGITGAATSPNITITWPATGELDQLDLGRYTAILTATRDSDAKQRKLRFPLTIETATSTRWMPAR
jgi:hypothetical protein